MTAVRKGWTFKLFEGRMHTMGLTLFAELTVTS